MIAGTLTQEQNELLDKQLAPHEVEERRGAFGKMLPYLKRSRAIQKANTIFGRGAWGMHFVLEPTLVQVHDRDGVATGAYYRCIVELQVQGCTPVQEEGLDLVEQTSVTEAVYTTRGWKDLEAEITFQEHAKACRTVTEAHIVAEYSCVAAAVKRLLTYYGRALGGELPYNDPRERQQTPKPQAQAKATAPAVEHNQAIAADAGDGEATKEQLSSIRKLCQLLGKEVPGQTLSNAMARAIIQKLSAEYNESRKATAR